MAHLKIIDSVEDVWSVLIDFGIATAEELQLITDINGYSEETLNDVIYARTGYRDLVQYMKAYYEGEL